MVALGAGPEILDVASAEAEPEAAAALVALNNADAEKLSPLSVEAFEALRREAFAAWRISAADRGGETLVRYRGERRRAMVVIGTSVTSP